MTLRVRHLPLTVAIVTATTFVAACGTSGQTSSTAKVDIPSDSSRTVEVAMEDIKFGQTNLTVKSGEIINFRFTNTGEVTHDAFIGDAAAQMDHETEMADAGGMGGHSMGEPAITVQPGDSGELSYTFDQPGTYEVGCHQPGHYAAGMKIDVTVE